MFTKTLCKRCIEYMLLFHIVENNAFDLTIHLDNTRFRFMNLNFCIIEPFSRVLVSYFMAKLALYKQLIIWCRKLENE